MASSEGYVYLPMYASGDEGKTSGMKGAKLAPKSAPKESGLVTKDVTEHVYPSGWKKVTKVRQSGKTKGVASTTYYNPEGDFFPSLIRAKEDGGFKGK